VRTSSFSNGDLAAAGVATALGGAVVASRDAELRSFT
jgi:hypothetical protein